MLRISWDTLTGAPRNPDQALLDLLEKCESGRETTPGDRPVEWKPFVFGRDWVVARSEGLRMSRETGCAASAPSRR